MSQIATDKRRITIDRQDDKRMSGHICQFCQKLPIVMSDDLHIKVSASPLFTLVSVSDAGTGGSGLLCPN